MFCDILMGWNLYKTSGQSRFYVHKTTSWCESIYYTFLSCWWFLFFWRGLIFFFFFFFFFKMENKEGKVKIFIELLFLVEKLEKKLGVNHLSSRLMTKWFSLFFSLHWLLTINDVLIVQTYFQFQILCFMFTPPT